MAAVLCVGLLATAPAGCESTQDKAAKLKREGSDAFARDGQKVGAANPAIKIVSTQLVRAKGAAAVVVRMRNASKRTLTRLPVAIDVRDAAKRSLFRNDSPGLEQSLVRVALLRSGEEFSWVNDQVLLATAVPKDVTARVGTGGQGPGRPPRMRIEQVKMELDGESTVANGFVRNASQTTQRELVVYAVARRAERVVAAGRAQIKSLKPSKRAAFTVFFVGDPRGAKLELKAPPTVLPKGGNG